LSKKEGGSCPLLYTASAGRGMIMNAGARRSGCGGARLAGHGHDTLVRIASADDFYTKFGAVMKYAVVVIDMQRGLFETDPEPFETAEVVARINALTARARSQGNPVVFVQHERQGSELAFGGAGWELISGLAVQESDIKVRKMTPDSFLRTDLEQVLKNRDVDALCICGYATEFCVDTTVRSAAAHGYPVFLVADAHTTHDKEHLPASLVRDHHNRTLSDVTSFGVPITAVACETFLRTEE